jgi:type II secretory pathway pseudopilin PulG
MIWQGTLEPLLTLIALLAAVVLILWFMKRSRFLLEQWAIHNDFVITRHQRRYYRRGPFLWKASNSQDVYYVTIWDRQSQKIRSGYVCCGSYWFGVITDKVTVIWD